MELGLIFYFVTVLTCSLLQPTHQQQTYVEDSRKQQQASPHSYHHHNSHKQHHKREDPEPPEDPLKNVRIIVPNLPPSHYQYWLKNQPRAFKHFEEVCRKAPKPISNITDLTAFQELHKKLHFENLEYMSNLDFGKSTLQSICSNIDIVSKSCWGYENNCEKIYLMPECLGTSHGEAKSEQEQKIKWFKQADFGYILERRKELSKFCAPDKRANLPDASSFECTKHFTTCRGDNLFIQLGKATSNKGILAREKLAITKVAGRSCDLQKQRIKDENGRTSQLESWYSELGNYHLIDPNEKCDIVIDKPAFFVKINSTLNLHDYLGTFINLYSTMHMNNLFSADTQIIIWDTRLPRNNRFEILFGAFSRNPPISAGDLVDKKVCVKKFIFVMPPKMVDGIHNRQSIIEGCSKSGLYHAFHKHIVHRIGLPMTYDQDFHDKTKNSLLRVSILSRSDSELRTIINENELEERIKGLSRRFYVNVIKYNSEDFKKMLTLALNSDILIGIHGAGLSYSLFAPDWASLIEIHDCGKSTYRNLARLRGLRYFSQKDLVKKIPVSPDSQRFNQLNQSKLLDHDEFNNYEVDIEAFLVLFEKAKSKLLERRAKYFESIDDPQQENGRAPSVPETTPSTTMTADVIISTPQTVSSTSISPPTTTKIETTTTETATTTTTTTPEPTTSSPAEVTQPSSPVEDPVYKENVDKLRGEQNNVAGSTSHIEL